MSNRRRRSRQHTSQNGGVAVSPRPTPLSKGGTETLIGLIATGAFDDDLPTLMRMIRERQRQVAQAHSVEALGRLRVGDRVRISAAIRPQYLRGALGTVAGWSGQRVRVLLDTPIGRFTAGEVSCPPLGVEPVAA